MNRHNDLQPMKISKHWKRQEGITGIGIAILLVIAAFFVLIAMRLFPVYVEHFSVTTHLENLAVDSDTKGKSDEEIWGKLKKTFEIDDVENVKDENLIVERHEGGSMTIAIEYEVRTSGFGNVDFVVVFYDEVEVN